MHIRISKYTNNAFYHVSDAYQMAGFGMH